jgi:hypothetical protein
MEDCIVGKHLSEGIDVAVGEGIVASTSEILVGMGHGRYLLSAGGSKAISFPRWRSSDLGAAGELRTCRPARRVARGR